jgi:hypothetical protein
MLIDEAGAVPHDVDAVDEVEPMYQFCKPPKGA